MKLNDSNLFRQQALINGEWLDANNGEVIDVTNPANGDKLGSVPKMGADETRAAIDAASRALPARVRSLPKNAPTFCATGSI
ncbi:hypothetical protein ECZU43_40960 [Escherichia coli]|nr:hypothetical protein ECZU43_40960 [Escherichia coli]